MPPATGATGGGGPTGRGACQFRARPFAPYFKQERVELPDATCALASAVSASVRYSLSVPAYLLTRSTRALAFNLICSFCVEPGWGACTPFSSYCRACTLCLQRAIVDATGLFCARRRGLIHAISCMRPQLVSVAPPSGAERAWRSSGRTIHGISLAPPPPPFCHGARCDAARVSYCSFSLMIVGAAVGLPAR